MQKEKRWPGHKNINNTTERDDPDMKKQIKRHNGMVRIWKSKKYNRMGWPGCENIK
jgi:hypothetical protein